MKAEIVSVGTELLLGEIVDTNASYIASQLPALGIDLYWVSQVGDNPARLVEVLKRAWQRSDLTFITGGLGPTDDDITREAIAEMMGEKLYVDPTLEAELLERFTSRRIQMAKSNIKQAMLIPSCKPIRNSRGTAPGWWLEKAGHTLLAMPGPPSEMQVMWQAEVLPKLKQKPAGAIIVSRTLKVTGLPEGTVGEMVTQWLNAPNPTMGIYGKSDGVHLRFGAKAQSQERAREMIAVEEKKVREIMGDAIWGVDDETLASVVGNILAQKKLSLAAMEYSLGGQLTSAITTSSDAVSWFKGSMIAHSLEALVGFGIASDLVNKYGTSSQEVAETMADIARKRLSTDVGVSVAGTIESQTKTSASNTGTIGLRGNPTVAFIGISTSAGNRAIRYSYPGNMTAVNQRITNGALFELRKVLLTL